MFKFAALAASASALVLATAAMAADLPYRSRAPAMDSAPIFTTFNWTGGYVGGHVGWRAANFDPVVNSLEIEGKTRHSLGGGAHAGYNYQISPNILIGVEGDLTYGQNRAKGPTAPIGGTLLTSRAELGWTGSVRGRLGYVQDRWMIYGTGGLAFADMLVQTTLVTPGASFTGRNDSWSPGYTVGAGIEFAVTPNILLRTEYLYADYGRHTSVVPTGAQTSVDVDTHTVRAGASYKF